MLVNEGNLGKALFRSKDPKKPPPNCISTQAGVPQFDHILRLKSICSCVILVGIDTIDWKAAKLQQQSKAKQSNHWTMANVHQHVLRILDDKAISALNDFNDVLKEKRIEVQDVTHTKAVTSLKAFNDTIRNLELDEPDENAKFRRDMRDLRTAIDNDQTTAEFQQFHSNYNSTYDRSEIQYVQIYARKRVKSDGTTVVEYILSRFSHKRFQNEAAKTVGSIMTVLGGGIAGVGMLAAGPAGWAVMGFGGASMVAGVTTVAAGRDDKIEEDHKIYIESAILDNLMHNALVRRENNQIVVEFQEG